MKSPLFTQISWICVLIGWANLLQGCVQAETTTSPSSVEVPEESSFRALARAYGESQKMLLIYGAENPQAANTYRGICEQLANNNRRGEWLVYEAAKVPLDSLKRYPIFLIGTPKGNSLLRQYEQQLPVDFMDSGFLFQGKRCEDPAYVFQLSFFPHPLSENLPLGLVTGVSDSAVLRHLSSIPTGRRNRWGSLWSRWGYEIHKAGKRVVMGSFGEDWKAKPDLHWDVEGDEEALASTRHFRIFDHRANLSRQSCKQLEDRLEERHEEILDFLGETNIPLSVAYHLYGSSELMALMNSQQTQGYVVPEKGEVHVIHHEVYTGNIVEPENHLSLRAVLGKPNRSILETGLCNRFSPYWQKHGGLYWAARLQASHNVLPLSELLSNQVPEGASYLVRGAMATALVEFLIDTWGKEQFIEQYATWNPSGSEILELEDSWQTWLLDLTVKMPLKKRKTAMMDYCRGMTFAHEGYNITNGYGSSLGRQSLQKIADVNANSIAIVPYSGTRKVRKPVPFRINQWAGGENDAAVVASFYDAKELGLKTLLKPQIWFPGSWPGEVEMHSEADWKSFFGHYRRWIRHYAMLAEIHEMDMFCVGVEFAKATQAHPEAWRTLVRDMRQIYQGPITYAANWGEEIENLAFGDELDVIGVDNYYPLSKKDSPSDAQLKSGFEDVKATLKKIHKRHNKPIMFTEIGFRSIPEPWKQPHEEANGASFFSKDQARCYQVILDGIRGEEWCVGMFWWKWPSYVDHHGRQNVSFSPCGKEAEKVLKKGYSRL